MLDQTSPYLRAIRDLGARVDAFHLLCALLPLAVESDIPQILNLREVGDGDNKDGRLSAFKSSTGSCTSLPRRLCWLRLSRQSWPRIASTCINLHRRMHSPVRLLFCSFFLGT